MFKESKIDDFGRLVIKVVKNSRLFDATLDFLELGIENGINVEEKILFVGEYQRLLLESLILGICHILIDKPCKCEYAKSKMQTELNSVVEKLESDISQKQSCVNFTVAQKKEILSEIKAIRDSQEYKRAIDAIKTMRNKKVAHFDSAELKNKSLFYEQIKLAVNSIKRCYEIRQLVLSGVGEVRINSVADYNHRNIIEALVLQREITDLKDKYHNHEWKLQEKWFSCAIDFWNEKIKPELESSKEQNT